jgi:hypothetical protein
LCAGVYDLLESWPGESSGDELLDSFREDLSACCLFTEFVEELCSAFFSVVVGRAVVEFV